MLRSIIQHHQHRLVMLLLLSFAKLGEVKVQLRDVDGFPCTLVARDFARGIVTDAQNDWGKLIFCAWMMSSYVTQLYNYF